MTEDKPVRITETTATVYRIRNIRHAGWADITLREWDGGGSFDCQSDYGNFAYVWGSIGDRNLREFLCGLNKDYFMKKTRPHDYREFSVEKTCKEIQREIISQRRERTITKEDASLCWEQSHEIDTRTASNEGFYHCMEEFDIVDKIFCGDYTALPTRTEYNPMCDMFWEKVWPHITKYWKENPE